MTARRRPWRSRWLAATALLAMSAQCAAAAPCSGDAVSSDTAAEPSAPVRISIDGVALEPHDIGEAVTRERCTVAMLQADLQVRYDPLEQAPFLNVMALPQNAVAGQSVRFVTYTNYPRYLVRAELRLFAPGQSIQQSPLAVIAVEPGATVEWTAPAAGKPLLKLTTRLEAPKYVSYLLRVYDAKGRFDETRPRRLDLIAAASPERIDAEKVARDLERSSYGENTLALHNIPVHGGAVTVEGSHVPPGNRVLVQGLPIPLDDERHFVARQILPGGPQQISVEILNERGEGLKFSRNLTVASDDSFFVGIADFTAGHGSTGGSIDLVTNDTGAARRDYVNGTLAFYYKGLVKGEWLLTAAADTRDQPVRNLFSNFASKNPQELLRRIDPNRYYPVYGDDSTTVQDAPTAGKFFVRLERGESSILWGDFQSHLTGTDFIQYTRTLYGANLRYRSADVTTLGEKKRSVDAFWAEPGTLASRQEFRGTGGSLYYLQNQDISVGSEQVWLQVRDKDSGLVLSVTPLVPAQDYDVNYMQGRILLRSPLSATANVASMVHSGGLDGDPAYLIVTYEYAPDFSSPSSLALGGHASEWFGEHLQLGLTDFHQGDPGERQDLRGVDGTLRYRPGTYIKSEFAHSDGSGSPTLTSITGGLAFNPLSATGGPANAERVEAAVDLAEVTSAMKGRATAYAQDRAANFSGPGQITPGAGARQEGGSASIPLSAATQVAAKFDNTDSALQTLHSGEVGIEHRLDEHWRIALGARIDERSTAVANASALLSQNGERTDVAVTVGYQPAAGSLPKTNPGLARGVGAATPWDVYGFVQDTVQRTETRPENSRAGIGGSYQVSKAMRLGAETSEGSLGVGGKLSTDYRIDERSNVYLNYTMAAEQPDALNVGRSGMLTTGTRYRYSDATSVYGEERVQNGSGPNSLTRGFGVDFAPNKQWTYGLKFEHGTVSDPRAGDLGLSAIAATLDYTYQKIKYTGALEWRENASSLHGDSRTELTRNSLTYQVDPDWRLFGKLNWSQTDAAATTTLNAQFREIITGAAWRPTRDDRWNTLFKFTSLSDQPSSAQLSSAAYTVNIAQRSRVLDVDNTYQITRWVSFGVKYAIRVGELKPTELSGEWYASQAQLWIVRTDIRIQRDWDGLFEVRRLSIRETDDARSGLLVGAYRHVGQHLKIGAGYNFTRYSDNLTDLNYRSQGLFVNTIGKF